MKKSISVSGLSAERSIRLFIAVLSALAVSTAVFAVDYKSTDATTTHAAQVRVAADFTKQWRCGVRLGLSEELRFDVYNSAMGPAFRKSYTTLGLGYAPIDYLRLDAGYTLKVLGPDSTWSQTKRADWNEYLRHRVYLGLTAQYRMQYAKIYLRERVLMEARTDSVNPLEKNAIDWQLRSRLGAEFYPPGKPLKPYVWCELINTLNAPEYQQLNGRQYISSVRTQVGLKWRLTKLSSLDFFYRFTYDYDRDINVTKKKSYVELTEQTTYQHAIGIAYSLDW